MLDLPSPAALRALREKEAWPALLVGLLAATFSAFHLYTSFRGTLPTLQQVYVHLSFALVLIFLTVPSFGKESRLRAFRWVIDAPFAVGSAIIGIYVVMNFMDISQRGAGDPAQATVVLGIVATVLVLEGTRRMIGWALPALAIIFIIYAFVGPHMPGMLAHRGFDIERLASTFYISASGIAGTPLQVSATYVAVFVIFAAIAGQAAGTVDAAAGLADGIEAGHAGETLGVDEHAAHLAMRGRAHHRPALARL